MKTTSMKTKLASVLCIALIAASALCATGCDGSDNQGTANQQASQTQGQTQTAGTFEDGAQLGEGAVQFTFAVTGVDGDTTTATVNTDAATVGEALLDLGVIAGEDSEYGLYVKTVNGTTLDYDADGKYWAFYVDGQYALSGVDSTDVVAGTTYEFRAE